MTASEKGHNSMTSGEQDEEGRHRHRSGTWTPQVRLGHAPGHAAPDPVVVPPPTPAETTMPGLRKFDLGTIPAPVTPPGSWRRAAWFVIGASLAVVAGLVVAAATLVGKPRSTGTIDALPGYPSLPSFFQSSSEVSRPVPRFTVTQGTRQTPVPPASVRREPSGDVVITVPPVPSITVPPRSVPTATPLPPPVRETAPMRAFASNDPQEIGDRTETFYQQVTADPAAAYAMTTGEMHAQGEQGFRMRYAGIRSVHVRYIEIDPNQGTTVSEVTVTRQDGSTFVERRRLEFTSGRNPKISSEVTH